MALHNETGKFGEDLAANLLRQKGYRILEQNWKIGNLEIDVIAEEKETVVFAEVKTRSTNYGGKSPEEYVDTQKQRNICHAAAIYIKQHQIDKTPRFDIIAAVINPESHEVQELRHIENAYSVQMRTISQQTYKPENRWHSKESRFKKKRKL